MQVSSSRALRFLSFFMVSLHFYHFKIQSPFVAPPPEVCWNLNQHYLKMLWHKFDFFLPLWFFRRFFKIANNFFHNCLLSPLVWRHSFQFQHIWIHFIFHLSFVSKKSKNLSCKSSKKVKNVLNSFQTDRRTTARVS